MADDRHITLGGRWAARHARQTLVLRVALVPWILFITVFLCVKGYWWGLIFLPFLALDLWLAGNLIRYIRSGARPPENLTA